jgi:hypothetical protein
MGDVQNNITERRICVVSTAASYLGGPGFKSPPGNRLGGGVSWLYLVSPGSAEMVP